MDDEWRVKNRGEGDKARILCWTCEGKVNDYEQEEEKEGEDANMKEEVK